MTFTLSSGQASFTLPLDPQNWDYNVNPRKSVTKTLGGQVVQLLGYSYSGSFGGLIHGGSVLKRDDLPSRMAWSDVVLLKQFLVNAMKNQKQGVKSHIVWQEQGYDFDCALGDLTIQEDLSTVAYRYTIPFYQVRAGSMHDGSSYATTLNRLLYEIGDMNANAYHGGSGNTSSIQAVTGFNEYGPTVTSSSSSSSSSSAGTTAPQGEIQEYAHSKMAEYGWTESDFASLVQMWNKESGWSPTADNPTSDAYGIPQAMCDPRIHPELFSGRYGDYKTNWKTQIDWGLNYIKGRYGSPSAAWSFWQRNHWY